MGRSLSRCGAMCCVARSPPARKPWGCCWRSRTAQNLAACNNAARIGYRGSRSKGPSGPRSQAGAWERACKDDPSCGRAAPIDKQSGPPAFARFRDGAGWTVGNALCGVPPCRRQVRLRRHLFQQPTGVGRRGDEIARGHVLRSVQQVSLPGEFVRRAGSLAPSRAVGKHEGQLT